MKLSIVLLLVFLMGCTAPTEMTQREPQHLSWSPKYQQAEALGTNAVVDVEMNKYGLLVISVNGTKVAHRVNWCVEIVEAENK